MNKISPEYTNDWTTKTDKCPIMNTCRKTSKLSYQHLTNLARMLTYNTRPDVTEKVSKKSGSSVQPFLSNTRLIDKQE